MSLRGPVITLKASAEGASLMGRVGRVGRLSKVSFKFLHTLWTFSTCIYILVYEIKIVTNILMGFKIWCQVGGGGTQFSKLPYIREFLNIWFQKSTDISDKTKSVNDLSKISIFFVEKTFCFLFFLVRCFNCCSLPYTVLFFLWGSKFVFSEGF